METKKLKKILAIIFCICLAIYFAYAVILLIIHPTEIYVITKGEIKEEEETVGYIIRNETVIKDEDNLNGIYAITTEGQKVAKDEVVFRYYKESEKETTENIKKIDYEIQEELEKDKTSPSSADIKVIVKKVDKNVKSIIENGKYKTKNGKIKKYKFYAAEENTSVLKEVYLSNKGADNRVSLKENNKVYLNDVYIINNVDDINYTSGTKNSSALIIRKDGSIWRLDIGGKSPKLTKVRSGKDKYKKISKPTNLKATQSGKNNAKVKWSKVEGATKYTVYRSTIKNGKYKKIGTSKKNSYKDTKLKKGQKYYYKVVANYSDSKYNSDMSSSVNVKISK